MYKIFINFLILFFCFSNSTFAEYDKIKIRGIIGQVINEKQIDLEYEAIWKPEVELAGNWLNGSAIIQMQNPFVINGNPDKKIEIYFPEFTFGTWAKFYDHDPEVNKPFQELNLKNEVFTENFYSDYKLYKSCSELDRYMDYVEIFSLHSNEKDLCIDFSSLPRVSFFPKGLFGYLGVILEIPQNGQRMLSKYLFYSLDETIPYEDYESISGKTSIRYLRHQFDFDSMSIINVNQNIYIQYNSCGAKCSYSKLYKYIFSEGFSEIANYTHHNNEIKFIN